MVKRESREILVFSSGGTRQIAVTVAAAAAAVATATATAAAAAVTAVVKDMEAMEFCEGRMANGETELVNATSKFTVTIGDDVVGE